MPRDKGDGGPAFPRPISHTQGEVYEAQDGLSLRDYFAAKAITGMVEFNGDPKIMAEWAYKIADAMLSAREEKRDA